MQRTWGKTELNSPFSKGDQNRLLHPNQKSEGLIKVCISEVFCCISKNHTVWVCLIDLSKFRKEIYRRRKKPQKITNPSKFQTPQKRRHFPRSALPFTCDNTRENKQISIWSSACQTPTHLSLNKAENGAFSLPPCVPSRCCPTVVHQQVWPQAALPQQAAGGRRRRRHFGHGDVEAQAPQLPHKILPGRLGLVGAQLQLQPRGFDPVGGRQQRG